MKGQKSSLDFYNTSCIMSSFFIKNNNNRDCTQYNVSESIDITNINL